MNITSPRQLINALPDVLGTDLFESLFLVSLDDGQIGRYAVISDVSDDAVGNQAQEFLSSLTIDGAPSVVAIARIPDSQQAKELLTEIQQVAHALEVHILDLLHIGADRWRSVLCDDESCCPSLGHLLDSQAPEVDDETVRAPDVQDDIEASGCLVVRSLDESAVMARDQAFSELPAWPEGNPQEMFPWRDKMVNQVVTILSTELDDVFAALALTSVTLADIRARDGVLRRILDSEDVRSIISQNLITLFAIAHDEHRAALATTYAGTAWLTGRRAVTRHAIDVALECDQQYSLARLLDTALVHGVPHRVWVDSLSAVGYDKCLAGAA